MFVADLSSLQIDDQPFANGLIEVNKGEMVGIFGRNGVGKTTIMRALAGLGDPLMRRTYEGWPIDPSDGQVNMVFQKDNLIPWLTVLDNLLLSSTRFDRSGSEECRLYLKKFGLEHLAKRWPRSLSGGETKLIELARAYREADRHILILDEPFTALDHEFQIKIEAFVRNELREIYDGIIIVSHELMRLASLTTKVYVFLRSKDNPLGLLEVRREGLSEREYGKAIADAFEAQTVAVAA